MRTISRLFDSHTHALAAVRDLEQAGFDDDQISLVANNADNWHTGEGLGGAVAKDADGDGENDVAEGAGKGAVTGAALGGGAGLLAGLGLLAIPGLGPVVAAGWLASTAVGAAVGAAAGGATGGILGALKDAGHTDEEANVYSEGVRRGGSLVSVRADETEIGRAEQILSQHGGVDASTRGQTYRQAGWTGFDETAAPYTSDQIASERRLYDEERSFARRGDDDTLMPDTDERDRDISRGTTSPSPGRDY